MIRLQDTLTLSLTKLRTRKIRLLVTVVVSGLLFTGLAAASIVARGTFASIEGFSREGFGDRYIMTGTAESDAYFSITENEDVKARATAVYKDTIARKKAEAKRLGLIYDPVTDPGPVEEVDTGGGKIKNLNIGHPAAKTAIMEYLAANPGPSLADFEAAAKPYGATAYYESRRRPFAGDGSSLQVLKDGKENYTASSQNPGIPSATDSFLIYWTSMSGGLLGPFLLSGQNLDKADDGAVPIIIPVEAAEQLLGLAPLGGSAAADEKLARIKDVRARAGDLRFEVCYRNNTSAGLISSATSVQQEIDQNKSNRDYQKPELIYGLPAEACGAAPVLRDVRSTGTKKLAAKQDEFDRIFGKQPAEQKKFRFRVVGVVPGFDSGAASSVNDIVSSLLVSSLGAGWFMPAEYLVSDPSLKAVFDSEGDIYNAPSSYYAEFADPDRALAFEAEQSCQPDYSVPNPAEYLAPCKVANKPFSVYAFGSNSLALDSAKRGFGKYFAIATLVIAAIAAIIMMGTVGRMIADSRRETAVFRAIGAKKLDIAQVYVLYTIMLSLLVCAFAIIAGALLASYLHNRFSGTLTVEALVAYNAQDLGRTFRLYSFFPRDMMYLGAVTLAAGLLSSVFPLLRNLRRNPIRDMRDDT